MLFTYSPRSRWRAKFRGNLPIRVGVMRISRATLFLKEWLQWITLWFSIDFQLANAASILTTDIFRLLYSMEKSSAVGTACWLDLAMPALACPISDLGMVEYLFEVIIVFMIMNFLNTYIKEKQKTLGFVPWKNRGYNVQPNVTLLDTPPQGFSKLLLAREISKRICILSLTFNVSWFIVFTFYWIEFRQTNYCNNCKTTEFIWLAWETIAAPACISTFCWAIRAASVAISVSMILPWADSRLIWFSSSIRDA